MSELQEAVETEVVETPNTGFTYDDGDEGTELATDTAEVQETNTEDEVEQEVKVEPVADNEESQADDLTENTKKAINKKHYQFKEEERKRIAVERELEELRAKQTETKLPAGPVEVPPIPDSWDEDFDRKVQERDAAIARNAEHNREQYYQAENQKRQEQERLTAQTEYVRKLDEAFEKNSSDLGLDFAKVNESAGKLINYLDAETAREIMQDPEGALVVMYLDANLHELDAYNALSERQKGIAFSDMKQKAQSFKPKRSSAPEPSPSVNGRAAPSERGPKNATFE